MDIFSALADPTRRSILELLAQRGKLTATEIYDQFPVSRPAISQHLKVLREAGVVRVEKRAQQRIYQINPQAMHELEGWARKLTQLWTQRFDALEQVIAAQIAEAQKAEPEQAGQGQGTSPPQHPADQAAEESGQTDQPPESFQTQ
jgi:DNA-binding transcriptional ArsR family regulator